MTKLKKDPLLGSAQVLLAMLIVMVVFSMGMIVIGAGVLLTVQRTAILAKLAEANAPDSAIWAIMGLLILVFGFIYLAYRFLRELYSIVGTVGQGDPFQPANADRLSRMGWLAFAAQLLGIPMMAVIQWILKYLPEESSHGFEVGFSGGGILLILTLFILARVFRKGTEMREDLEGTV